VTGVVVVALVGYLWLAGNKIGTETTGGASLAGGKKGYSLETFADRLGGNPRVLEFDRNWVLVASVTDAGKVVVLPDLNRDGRADQVIDLITGLKNPHGIAFWKNWIYVAETNQVSRFVYNPDNLSVGKRERLFELPDSGGHFTRTIRFIDNKLYVSVGSSCNVCVENDKRRAVLLVSEPDGSDIKIFATGLRNTVFFVEHAGKIYGSDMGRDMLGDSLPPEEINVIERGGNYGWPSCYGNGVPDPEFADNADCSRSVNPVLKLPAHVAPLGLRFVSSAKFPPEWQGDLLVALHGSWNSSVKVGYKIIRIKLKSEGFTDVSDFVGGFIVNEDVTGRPVDLIFNNEGDLFVSDDKRGAIFRVRI